MPASLADHGSLIQYCPQGVSPEMMAVLHANHYQAQVDRSAESPGQHDQHLTHHGHHGHHVDKTEFAGADSIKPGDGRHTGHALEAGSKLQGGAYADTHSGGHSVESHDGLWQSHCDYGTGANAGNIASQSLQEQLEVIPSIAGSSVDINTSPQSRYRLAHGQRAPPLSHLIPQ